jgi:hypothetical protein
MLDGSLSDTAVGHIHGMDGSRRKMVGNSERSGKPMAGGGSGSCQFVGLGKKSSSTSQLSATGKEELFLHFFSMFLLFHCLSFHYMQNIMLDTWGHIQYFLNLFDMEYAFNFVTGWCCPIKVVPFQGYAAGPLFLPLLEAWWNSFFCNFIRMVSDCSWILGRSWKQWSGSHR